MSENEKAARSRSSVGHDGVAAALAQEILSGSRPPGSRMPSAEAINERFSVSRVMTREVTKTLAAKGLIAGKTRVGTVVLPPNRWNWFDPDVLAWRVRVGLDDDFLRHLAQMRRAVEPAAAALAAAGTKAEHLADMRSALDNMTQAGGDRYAFGEADLQFHIAVGVASANPLFRSFASVIETALRAYLSITTPLDEEAMALTVTRHARVVDAIEQRNADAASSAMLEVIDEGVTRATSTRYRD